MSKVEKDIIIAIHKAVKAAFPDCPADTLSNIYLEIPKEKRFGDFSTNIAMRLTRDLKKAPLDIATVIVKKIKKTDAIQDIRIEGPGFINLYLSDRVLIEALREIIGAGDGYGCLPIGNGREVQIEFVSANPTGPLTVAHGRQAAVGDSLARILESCGYKVTREYYINDEGVQMDILSRSVKARFMELMGEKSSFPENGYKGAYIYEIAKEMHKSPRIKKQIAADIESGLSEDFFKDYAYKWIMRTIKKDLQDFGVSFDVWYSQKGLLESGKIEKAFSLLKTRGFLYKKDGATWFSSTRFRDDKDRVVIKKDGSLTYLASDIAYHREKFERGYDKVIDIWGPDHHGYVNRLKAACEALGFDKDKLSILISQLVTLYRDKKPVRMSTREGEFITLRQVIDEVGRDAGRFFFIMRRTDSHLDFDLELAKARTMDNPVYYIQYAHARIASIIKFYTDALSSSPLSPKTEGVRISEDLHLLDRPEEIGLVKKLMQYPRTVEMASRNLEPYIVLSYLQNLASLFHSYYNSCRIVTEDSSLSAARIALAKVIKSVLFSGLRLLGVNTPEKM